MIGYVGSDRPATLYVPGPRIRQVTTDSGLGFDASDAMHRAEVKEKANATNIVVDIFFMFASSGVINISTEAYYHLNLDALISVIKSAH